MPSVADRATDRLPVLVVGAGIAGLTAAAAIGRRGMAVEIIERRDVISDGGGVGLSVVGNAMRALDDIGVAGACVAAGVAADSLAMCRPDGTVLFENPLPRIGGADWPGATGITRARFHAILHDAAKSVATIRCGLTVERWQEEEGGVRVEFSDGTVATYALMVAADGIYSSTRAVLFPDSRPEPTGQAVWRAEVPRPASVSRTHLFLGGPQGLVGICPVSDEAAYIYVVQTAEPGERRDPDTLDVQMRQELAGYGGVVEACLAHLDDPSKVSYRPIEWVMAPRPLSRGRVAIIGDAAHAGPPVLAQGAAMGIEDAIVLAGELAASPDDVPAALERTCARRYDRALFVVETSRQLAKWEVEHTRDVDIPGVMRAASQKLAEPI